jgi:cell division protein FtsX
MILGVGQPDVRNIEYPDSEKALKKLIRHIGYNLAVL